MLRTYLLIAFLSVFAVVSFGQSSVQVGANAPTFSIVGLDGKNYDLSEMRGRVVVLTFWSTRCEICRAEFPRFNRIIKDYEDKNAVFLALTMNNESLVKTYLRSNRLEAKILPNGFGVVMQYADRDSSGRIAMGFPSLFVIDKEGRVQHKSSGFSGFDQLDSTLRRLGAN
jgi:peroxiredoxin